MTLALASDAIHPPSRWDRRTFLTAAIGTLAVSGLGAQAQAPQPVSPNPTPRDWSRPEPLRYPDPDVVALDPRFRPYIIRNTPLMRLHVGTLWAEGPAWNGVGRYLVWSDIPNNLQHRWVEEDGRVTTFRRPAGNSNGNTFDLEGRQLSCEHGGRRVVRYEYDGSVTVIADKFQGKRLNSPNDAVVHPDGGIWFTDPIYGIRGNYEGAKSESETKEAVYRVDPKSLQIEKVNDEAGQPNGLCFSPDDRCHDSAHRLPGRSRGPPTQAVALCERPRLRRCSRSAALPTLRPPRGPSLPYCADDKKSSGARAATRWHPTSSTRRPSWSPPSDHCRCLARSAQPPRWLG